MKAKIPPAGGTQCISKTRSKIVLWFSPRALALRFLVRFCILLCFFYAVILFSAFDHAFYIFLCATARLAGAVLNVFGQQTVVSGTMIRSARFNVSIQRGCDALEPAWFFCAAVLAFPGHWSKKPVGLAVGVAAIFALNMARIISLYFIGIYFPGFFPAAHLEVWPVILIFMTLLLMSAWIRFAQNAARPKNYVAT
jgi:exosortase H (IPTLxxWG-CTERM-specific)